MDSKTFSSTLTFNEIKIEGYEKVIEVKEKSSGMHGIIAIHNTKLGPALGGLRAYPYLTFDAALDDVLRLSRGMTYKSAIVEAGTGGGKSILILDPKKGVTEEILLAFAEAINTLKGEYITAEDIGISPAHLALMRNRTSYAVGLPHEKSSGDPSRFTAMGGFRGVQAACKKIWGTSSVRGKKVAIQGLGAVGMKLAHLLFWEGADLVVTDINQNRLKEVQRDLGAQIVTPDEIYQVECDIFAPCAMGGILNEKTIPSLRCQAIAGVANNQLRTDADGEALQKRGILYAPDFAINAGGLLNVCCEIEEKGYDSRVARDRVLRLYDLLLFIFNLAEERGESTQKVAAALAMDNLAKGIGKRNKPVTFHH